MSLRVFTAKFRNHLYVSCEWKLNAVCWWLVELKQKALDIELYIIVTIKLSSTAGELAARYLGSLATVPARCRHLTLEEWLQVLQLPRNASEGVSRLCRRRFKVRVRERDIHAPWDGVQSKFRFVTHPVFNWCPNGKNLWLVLLLCERFVITVSSPKKMLVTMRRQPPYSYTSCYLLYSAVLNDMHI